MGAVVAVLVFSVWLVGFLLHLDMRSLEESVRGRGRGNG